MSTPPPGWYTDPNDPTGERWWDGSAWSAHQRGRSASTSGNPAPPRVASPAPLPPASGPTGRWYFVVVFLSGGLFAAVPFFHAASRLDRPSLRRTGAIVAAGSLVGATLVGLAPVDDTGSPTGVLSNLGGTVLVAVVVIATLLLISPRKEVYGSNGAPAAPSRNEGAVSAAREVRRRRSEALRLVADDPATARELGIGRPDRSRAYDDGGLIDLNWADAAHLQASLDVSDAQATALVAARESLGGFTSIEEAIAFADIDDASAARVRDRSVIFPR